MKTRIDLLKEVKSELKRFNKKIDLAIEECSNRNFASCKRSAMDLKHELTKITQDTKYLYGDQ